MPLFAEMSPEGWAIVIAAVAAAIIGPAVTIVGGYFTFQLKLQELKNQNTSQSKDIKEVKSLVNGQSTADKVTISKLARDLANLTGDQTHVLAAEAAELVLKQKLDAEAQPPL